MNRETVSKVKCIECLNLSVQDSFKYNRDTGLAVCRNKRSTVPLNRFLPCMSYQPAAQQTIEKRIQWRDGK